MSQQSTIRRGRSNIRRIPVIHDPFARDAQGVPHEEPSDLAASAVALWYVRAMATLNTLMDDAMTVQLRHGAMLGDVDVSGLLRGLETSLSALQGSPPRIG